MADDKPGILLPKLVGEACFVDFDFSDLFDEDVTIASHEFSFEQYPVDADFGSDDLNMVSDNVAGMVVSAELDKGVSGVSYLLYCLATGSDGSKQGIQLVLPVVNRRIG